MAGTGVIQTETGTIILMPYGGDTRHWRFPVNPQPPIKTGRTKVFPTRATMGPTNADVDDTLFTFNVEDVSGGIGVWKINPTQDLGKVWYSVAGTEGTDGMTAAREAIMRQPSSFTGNCVPVGRIGVSTYALWGTTLYLWNPDDLTWTTTTRVVGTVVNTEGIVSFDDKMFFPLGANGYAYVSETAPGTLSAVTVVAGNVTPAYSDVAETENPCVQIFCVHQDKLWAITTKAEGYHLVSSLTGNSADWDWEFTVDTTRGRRIKIQKSFEPKAMAEFPNAQSGRSLWVSGRGGLMVYSPSDNGFLPTTLVGVPPHPNFGTAMQQFRPGESLWIAGGGGDAIQYTAGGAVVPASGPGGANEGLPVNRRGSIKSFASDLFRMYGLMEGEPGESASGDVIEDSEGGDPIYAPGPVAVVSLLGWTGKGWHPQWDSEQPGVGVGDVQIQSAADAPTKVVVSDSLKANGQVDYRVFWGVGEECWSMVCRLSTHSSRQAIQNGTGERFATESYIEWGRFNAGSIANNKLASHAALLMEHASATDYVEYQYYTERTPYEGYDGQAEPWITLGSAKTDADASPPTPRVVLPFGMRDPTYDANGELAGGFSEGESLQWIRQRLRFVTTNPLRPAICTAVTLAFLPQPQDAATKAYTIPLPVDLCPRTNQTAQMIINKLEALLSPDEGEERFLLLQDGQRVYRAYISSISYAAVPSTDGPGALNLTVIQIPTGRAGLLGEVDPIDIDNP